MNNELIEELANRGETFNEADIVFITKDATGEIIWLENGNETAGLIHIVERHGDDFKRTSGLNVEEIPVFLERVVSQGVVVSNLPSKARTGYTRIYDYDGSYYTVTGIGTNGFIVTAYPTPKEG